MENKKKFKIVYNSPVVLTFTLICIIALILNYITMGASNYLLFSVYRSSLVNPLTYIRLFTHVLGHANLAHLTSNLMMLLVIGPILEEKYGSKDLLFIIMATAFITGIVNSLLFPHTALLGASGVVFAFIILASITGIKDHEIPLTLIFVAVLYIGEQIYDGIFMADNISQLTHIVGGFVGGMLGLLAASDKS